MRDDNPINGDSPDTYDEAHFVDDQAYALYDAYLMARDAGASASDLGWLALVIDKTTIYNQKDPENMYQNTDDRIEAQELDDGHPDDDV